ncbi:hypothetical protein CJ030_MR7G002264 [Morella rubra]|uniref:Uncharacterized protein n=1 Tax=Morella rubra TaxID=262757 RepID=A0A6A1V3L8_9ROSI|nr:hypothetical protein CJ030_MR7G002264 [Morella rubra]
MIWMMTIMVLGMIWMVRVRVFFYGGEYDMDGEGEGGFYGGEYDMNGEGVFNDDDGDEDGVGDGKGDDEQLNAREIEEAPQKFTEAEDSMSESVNEGEEGLQSRTKYSEFHETDLTSGKRLSLCTGMSKCNKIVVAKCPGEGRGRERRPRGNHPQDRSSGLVGP